jgi:localization factor PodJL
MAGLYETGDAGVIRNPAEVRRWTALAAEGGSPKAMHNLAVYYFHGDGGPKDLGSAALWFRKAAELGVVESQYNLGMLYQSGSGGQKDLAEARKWFDLAAVQGDAQARRAADALAPPPAAGEALMNVPVTKRALARLGYYNGPLDGEATPAYKAALADYQRDRAIVVRR